MDNNIPHPDENSDLVSDESKSYESLNHQRYKKLLPFLLLLIVALIIGGYIYYGMVNTPGSDVPTPVSETDQGESLQEKSERLNELSSSFDDSVELTPEQLQRLQEVSGETIGEVPEPTSEQLERLQQLNQEVYQPPVQ